MEGLVRKRKEEVGKETGSPRESQRASKRRAGTRVPAHVHTQWSREATRADGLRGAFPRFISEASSQALELRRRHVLVALIHTL